MNTETLRSSCFQSSEWLKSHIFTILNFYYPQCMDDKNEGYYNCFLDDGTICDYNTKHLISTTRFIYDFSVGSIIGNQPGWYVRALSQGLSFLQKNHLDHKNGGYYWILRDQRVEDPTKFAYGHAFVLLSAARAAQAGMAQATKIIEYTYNVLEKHFWEPRYRLYKDEISADWSVVSPYRGQNSNMHMCEAMMAAYDATSNVKYLQRAYDLAKSVTVKLAAQSGGMIWENFYPDWTIDWTYYEKDESLQQFRPTGFVPGHQIEWSKLLLLLERYYHEDWMLERAKYLYHAGLSKGFDPQYGGVFYLLSRDGAVINTDKIYWVLAETIGASALMAVRKNSQYYWDVYNSMFRYCWSYMIDTVYGGWYNILNREGKRYSNIKSPLTKTDYHPIANCYETIRALSLI
ncbi:MULTISPECIES: AGE family epimerase/isomerase [Clostridia]|uniref:AGE family epimerase/isomerase n=1 Tax=Clostridia TaxID=186801 RepID=UPI002553AC9C|nr:AGE family epimerase/isomerase [Proteiniborus sp. MB09-C3]WIV12871.1 AGE family epimerase/isomerase [Proteiniborus sp. MB09-C3]